MNDKKIILFTIVIVTIILVGGYFLLAGSNGKQVPILSYSTSDKERPRVSLDKTSADIGQMKVSDQKAKDFVLKNIGTKPLQLSNIKSSCNCATGQVIIDGKESDEFGMHSASEQVFEIAPGKSATIRMIYRPYIMPVYGPVERELYIDSNDPEKTRLILQIKANVK